MRIAIGPAGTPEWHLCSFVREAAAAAGITLEAKRFDGGEARRVASVHEGMAEVSVALAETVRWTYRAQGAYDGWRHTSLRAVAAIHHAQWLGVTARWETGISVLADLATARNLRLIAPLPGGESATWTFVAAQALTAHGAHAGELADRGWRVEDIAKGATRVRNLDFDVLIAPLGPVGSVHATLWQEASVLANLRFLPLSDTALDRLGSDHGLPRTTLPAAYLRGVVAPVPTVGFDRWTVFASERLEDSVALTLSRTLEARRASLLPLHAALDPLRSLDDLGLPVHRAVKRDRAERGLSDTVVAAGVPLL
jgi:TRAP-type uncharacterized transport system substrate-binding protein